MRNRQIRRTYLAVVEGITPPNGTIFAPISRVDDSVIERHVDFLRGEPAVTHYERLEVKNEHSLLEIHLETGRIKFGCIWDTSAIRFLRIICTIRYMIASNVSLSTLFSWNSDIRSLISLCACLHRFLKICAMPFDFICFCRI